MKGRQHGGPHRVAENCCGDNSGGHKRETNQHVGTDSSKTDHWQQEHGDEQCHLGRSAPHAASLAGGRSFRARRDSEASEARARRRVFRGHRSHAALLAQPLFLVQVQRRDQHLRRHEQVGAHLGRGTVHDTMQRRSRTPRAEAPRRRRVGSSTTRRSTRSSSTTSSIKRRRNSEARRCTGSPRTTSQAQSGRAPQERIWHGLVRVAASSG